jgi:hypothetical protein
VIPLILFLGAMIASVVIVSRKTTLSERHTIWLLWLHILFLLLAAIDIFLLSRDLSFIGFTTDPAIFLLLFATGALLHAAYRRQRVHFIRRLYSGIFYYVALAFLIFSICLSIYAPIWGIWISTNMILPIPVIPIDDTHAIRVTPEDMMVSTPNVQVIRYIGPLLEHTWQSDTYLSREDDIQVLEYVEGVKLRLRIFDPQQGSGERTIDLKDSE